MAEQMLAADGRPLKASLNRALRRQKMRALMLIAPLLIFILVSFVMPIADMLFRSVENQIVSETLPRTVTALQDGYIPRAFDDLIAGVPAADQKAELARQNLPTDAMQIGLNGYLVQSGDHLTLIDTGAATG